LSELDKWKESWDDGLKIFWTGVGFTAAFVFAFFIMLLIWLGTATLGWSRDLDGKYAQSPLKNWFDQLASGKGLCCSFADGAQVDDVDWDTECADIAGAQECHYRVRLHGQWIDVPENALVTEPNRFGPAVVWPYMDQEGNTQIRCFIPGAGT
jgi:hypothetical protein